MNQNELRLLNYVLDDENNIVQILQISDQSLCTPTKVGTKYKCYFSNIFPIKLTMQSVRKFGFCKYENQQGSFLSPMVNGQKLKLRMDLFDSSRFYFVLNQNWIIDIKYVHELQNLYFALTGSELVFSTEP